MRKLLKSILMTLPVLFLLLLLGCSMFQDAITPAYIEPDAIKYTGEKATSFLPYTSLLDAYRIDNRMNYVHELTQIEYERLAADDTMEYGFLKDSAITNIAAAAEFKQMVFDPAGPLGLLLPAGFGTLIGATMISKPDDRRKIIELEKKNGG